jgi:hypothetical protein
MMTNKMTRQTHAANVMPVVVRTKCRHWQTHSLVWVALAAPSSSLSVGAKLFSTMLNGMVVDTWNGQMRKLHGL